MSLKTKTNLLRSRIPMVSFEESRKLIAHADPHDWSKTPKKEKKQQTKDEVKDQEKVKKKRKVPTFLLKKVKVATMKFARGGTKRVADLDQDIKVNQEILKKWTKKVDDSKKLKAKRIAARNLKKRDRERGRRECKWTQLVHNVHSAKKIVQRLYSGQKDGVINLKLPLIKLCKLQSGMMDEALNEESNKRQEKEDYVTDLLNLMVCSLDTESEDVNDDAVAEDEIVVSSPPKVKGKGKVKKRTESDKDEDWPGEFPRVLEGRSSVNRNFKEVLAEAEAEAEEEEEEEEEQVLPLMKKPRVAKFSPSGTIPQSKPIPPKVDHSFKVPAPPPLMRRPRAPIGVSPPKAKVTAAAKALSSQKVVEEQNMVALKEKAKKALVSVTTTTTTTTRTEERLGGLVPAELLAPSASTTKSNKSPLADDDDHQWSMEPAPYPTSFTECIQHQLQRDPVLFPALDDPLILPIPSDDSSSTDDISVLF